MCILIDIFTTIIQNKGPSQGIILPPSIHAKGVISMQDEGFDFAP